MKEIVAEEILELSWSDYKRNWRVLTSATVFILLAYGAIVYSIVALMAGSALAIAILPVLLIVVVILHLGFIKMLLNITGNKPIALSQLYGSCKYSVRYIVGTIAYSMLTAVGLCLLIVPGVVYALRYSLWWFLMVNKDLELVVSFQESKRMTQGSKRDLFFLYVATLGCNVVGLLAFGVGLLVSLPLSLLISIHAYRKLQLIRTNEKLKKNKSHWHENY